MHPRIGTLGGSQLAGRRFGIIGQTLPSAGLEIGKTEQGLSYNCCSKL